MLMCGILLRSYVNERESGEVLKIFDMHVIIQSIMW